MSQLFNDQVDSSIDEIVHVLIECLFELDHVSGHACLRYRDVLVQLILLQECLRGEVVEVDLYEHQELEDLLFVARIVRVALLEREPQLLPCFGLVIREHEDAALKVGQLDSPTHREHVLGKGRVVAIELNIDPLH